MVVDAPVSSVQIRAMGAEITYHQLLLGSIIVTVHNEYSGNVKVPYDRPEITG